MASPIAATSPAPAPPAFHFASTCILHELTESGLNHVNPPDAYTKEGLLGCVILSPGATFRKLLLYNEKKKPYLQTQIETDNVKIYPEKPLSFEVMDEKKKVCLRIFP